MIYTKDLPFTHLKAFEAIGRRGSMKEAADELGVAAGNLSKQLKELEALVGAQLIRRSPRGQLTEPGLKLLIQLQEGFGIISAAINQARAESGANDPVAFRSRSR